MTWFNVVETATYLGVSKETVYRLLKAEKIPAYRIGKLWRFPKEELDTWMIEGPEASVKKKKNKK